MWKSTCEIVDLDRPSEQTLKIPLEWRLTDIQAIGTSTELSAIPDTGHATVR